MHFSRLTVAWERGKEEEANPHFEKGNEGVERLLGSFFSFTLFLRVMPLSSPLCYLALKFFFSSEDNENRLRELGLFRSEKSGETLQRPSSS